MQWTRTNYDGIKATGIVRILYFVSNNRIESQKNKLTTTELC